MIFYYTDSSGVCAKKHQLWVAAWCNQPPLRALGEVNRSSTWRGDPNIQWIPRVYPTISSIIFSGLLFDGPYMVVKQKHGHTLICWTQIGSFFSDCMDWLWICLFRRGFCCWIRFQKHSTWNLKAQGVRPRLQLREGSWCEQATASLATRPSHDWNMLKPSTWIDFIIGWL